MDWFWIQLNLLLCVYIRFGSNRGFVAFFCNFVYSFVSRIRLCCKLESFDKMMCLRGVLVWSLLDIVDIFSWIQFS